eukprot:7322279-Lingulodinium_polyedra.AAC.1
MISARARTGLLLCGMAAGSRWPEQDKDAAAKAARGLKDAESQCLDQLGEVTRERRRLKPSRLPLWK